jgi:hypothetical protein
MSRFADAVKRPATGGTELRRTLAKLRPLGV